MASTVVRITTLDGKTHEITRRMSDFVQSQGRKFNDFRDLESEFLKAGGDNFHPTTLTGGMTVSGVMALRKLSASPVKLRATA